MSHGYEDKDIE